MLTVAALASRISTVAVSFGLTATVMPALSVAVNVTTTVSVPSTRASVAMPVTSMVAVVAPAVIVTEPVNAV